MIPELFPRRSTRGFIAGLSLTQTLWLGVPILLCLGVLISAGLGKALVCAVIVGVPGCVCAFVPLGTRKLGEWVGPIMEFFWKKAFRQDTYHRDLLAPVDAGALHLPGEGAALRLVEDATDSAALVYDRNGNTLTAIALLDHGQFLSLPDEERDSLSLSWGMAMSQIANIEGVTRFQVFSRSLPEMGDDLSKSFDELSDPSRASSLATRLYEDLLASSAASMRRHETYFAVQISRRKAAALVKDHGGGLGGLVAVMKDVRREVTEALRECGVNVDVWLPTSDLSRLIRSAYDPASFDELNAGLGTDISFAAPITSQEHWAHLRADSGFFQTWRVAAWPRIATTAGFLRPLLMDPKVGQISFSMIFEPVPHGKESRIIIRGLIQG